MQFIDLAAQQKRIRTMIETKIHTILDHGKYIMGPEVQELETRLAAFTGMEHAISCSSGTDALVMALLAYGVGPGDAVLTTPFTFIATAEAICLTGATPVFVDINAATFNIDPHKVVDAVHNPKLKGIITVDLFGLPADYDVMADAAKAAGLFIIEDAAQSFGAKYKGRQAAALGDITCTSFFPAKPLGCYGDGGAVFTNDALLSEKLQSIRIHGKGQDKYDNIRMGINGRLDTIQAAILLTKMDLLAEEIEMRQQVARRYTQLLSRFSGLTLPVIPPEMISAWAQYSILAENGSQRDLICKKLAAAKIPTAIYYPKPLHLQTAFKDLGYERGAFPVSEMCAQRIFSLPMHPYLAEDDQNRIAEIFKDIC